jgi:hypothetical protein
MANEFEDALSEITGASVATAPERQQEQSQAAPAESNAFEASLAEKLQETTASPEIARDTPEPGGGRER